MYGLMPTEGENRCLKASTTAASQTASGLKWVWHAAIDRGS